MFDQIRKRPAPLKHLYVERPAYIVTERELKALGELVVEAFQRGVREGERRTVRHTHSKPPQSYWPGG